MLCDFCRLCEEAPECSISTADLPVDWESKSLNVPFLSALHLNTYGGDALSFGEWGASDIKWAAAQLHDRVCTAAKESDGQNAAEYY